VEDGQLTIRGEKGAASARSADPSHCRRMPIWSGWTPSSQTVLILRIAKSETAKPKTIAIR